MRGKSFLFFPFYSSTSSWMTHFCGRFRSFSVIFGRFSGHFRSFLDMIPNDSEKSFLLIPFDSFSFLNPSFYALKHKKVIYFKISSIFFGGSRYSSYFCQRLTDDCRQSGRATVSPMAFSRRLFLCPRVSFSRQREKGVPIWRLHEP